MSAVVEFCRQLVRNSFAVYSVVCVRELLNKLPRNSFGKGGGVFRDASEPVL